MNMSPALVSAASMLRPPTLETPHPSAAVGPPRPAPSPALSPAGVAFRMTAGRTFVERLSLLRQQPPGRRLLLRAFERGRALQGVLRHVDRDARSVRTAIDL